MGIGEFRGNQRYKDRITSEHRVKPKFMAVQEVYLDKLEEVNDVLVGFREDFDLDSAIGVQLDMVGERVGAFRVLTFNPVYADSKLSDEDFKKYIRAKISMNQWDGTMRGLQELWEGLFGEYRIKVYDKQDMSIRAEFHGVKDLFEAELIEHGYFAPKAEGIYANYLFVMESEVSGGLFLGAACVDEYIVDTPSAFNNMPVEFSTKLQLASAIAAEIITDYLN